MFKILVVDDESLVRRGIVMETDWNALDCMVVAEASNGEEGLEAARRYRPDLIICDIRMPKMDGIEMLTTLRDERNDTHVIFLTAYSDFSYAQSAIRLSASDYLLKPFEDGELEKTVLAVKNKLEAKKLEGDAAHEQDVLSHSSIQKGEKSKYVTEALNYIKEHYGEYDISVRKIAESLGLSEGHLSHIFKKETDYTINAYITRYRIRSAMKLLQNCRYKVYEVAEMVGYKDITYFSTIFKKIAGVTPSEYQDRSQ